MFDAAGANLLYSSLFGGNGSQAGNEHPTFGSGVAVDSSGNFYLVGTTGSNQIPVTPGAFQTTYYGNPKPGFGTSTRGFVAKFNPVSSGASLAYATYLGGFDTDRGQLSGRHCRHCSRRGRQCIYQRQRLLRLPGYRGREQHDSLPFYRQLRKPRFSGQAQSRRKRAGLGHLCWDRITDPTLSAASTISPPRLDAQGNVYVSGVAGNNTEYPLVNPLQPANSFGGAYVTMYDPTGSTIYFSTVIYDPKVMAGYSTAAWMSIRKATSMWQATPPSPACRQPPALSKPL